MQITLNETQQLFVLKSAEGVSCLGFQVVYDRSCELVKRLFKAGVRFDPLRFAAGEPLVEPSKAEIGTPGQYKLYEALLKMYGLQRDNETWFTEATPAKVRAVLERYRKSREMLRVFLGDPLTGRDWLEEFETIGTVGRSVGTLKAPLLLLPGESGGAALSTSSIVRMIDVATGKEVYVHPTYHIPEMDLRLAEGDALAEGFTHSVWVKSKDKMVNHANFESIGKAAHWIAFMCGESNDIQED